MRKNRDTRIEMISSEDEGHSPKSRGSSAKETGQIFGLIQGVEVGQVWQSREELSRSWVHRPKFASLHAGQEGVSSILINSKYRGKDNGLSVMYSGPKVKRRGRNGIYLDSLIKNYKNKKPIRVIRGAKRNSDFAPPSGFRYDGLYEVDKYWKERDHMTFSLRRIMHQNMPPWIRTVPANISTESGVVLDSDFSPYISYIRCQPNSPPGIKSDLDENNTPLIEIKDSDDESPQEFEENNYEIEQDGDPPIDPMQIPPVPLPQDFSEHVQNDVFVIPEILPPPDEPDEIHPRFIGGVPFPKSIDFMKEEVTCSGLVVIETLPQQEVYEVFNESLEYEEEQAQITEVETDWKQEEEVEAKVSSDAGIVQINNSLISHMQKLGITTDIDVEDGPKFAHFLRGRATDSHSSPETPNVIINPDFRISKTNENESVPVQNIVKVDNNDWEDASEEIEQPQEWLLQESDELTEQTGAGIPETVEQEVDKNSSNCLYIYPGTKCESVDQAEEAILSGNFQWYQGSRPLDEESSKGFTLHEVQEMLVPDCQPDVSKQSEHDEGKDKEEEESSSFLPYKCQELCIPGAEKPDTTSQELEQNLKHYHSANQKCPYKDITLAEMLAYTFNESQEGCVCRWSDRLPCMNYCIQEILNARRNALSSPQERKQIMPKPQEQDKEEKLGRISSVGSVTPSGSCELNSVEYQDESQVQDPLESINIRTDFVNNQESNTSLAMVEQLPQPSNSQANVNSQMVSLKHVEVLWRGLEEVRDEAMKRVYKMPQPILDKDGLKAGEKELSSEEVKSLDVDEKGPKLPGWHYSDRKDLFLHHHLRKRRLSNITATANNDSNVMSLSPPTQESNPSLNKVRMVQVRNIRTRINRTRIVQVNNSQLSSTPSTDREMSSDSLENLQQQRKEGNIGKINNECNFNDWSSLHVIDEHTTASSLNSESTLERECEEFCQELQLQKEVLINTNLSPPVTLVVNEEEVQSLQRKEVSETSTVPYISVENIELPSDQPLNVAASSILDSVYKKSKVQTSPTEDLQIINNKEKLPSPESDTTSSFERTCDELCEALPKSESDIHCTLLSSTTTTTATTTTTPTAVPSSEIKEKRRRGRPRVRPVTSTSNITEVSSSTADSLTTTATTSPAETKRSYQKKRLNVSRNLKGFTSEDIAKTKRIRKVFQKIILQYKYASYLGGSTKKVEAFHDVYNVAKTKKLIKKRPQKRN